LQPSVHEGQSVLRNGIPLKSIPFPIVLPRSLPHDVVGHFYLTLLSREVKE
jgi:hypothetical protein